jgi:hypothetical protein
MLSIARSSRSSAPTLSFTPAQQHRLTQYWNCRCLDAPDRRVGRVGYLPRVIGVQHQPHRLPGAKSRDRCIGDALRVCDRH